MLAQNVTPTGPDTIPLKVLIVESHPDLGGLWARHLERLGMQVTCVSTQEEATAFIEDHTADIIILDLVLDEGCALTVSDFAQFRLPEAQVIFVTNTTFFSDGSIFAHSANARAFIRSGTPPEDLAAMVEYYGASS